MGGMSDEVYEQREKEREARAAARDTTLEAAKAERDQKVQTQLKEAQDDKKKFAEKKVAVDTMKKLNDKELASREAAAKAAEKSIDYNAGPEELLKQMANKEGSALVPKDSKDVAKNIATAAKSASPDTAATAQALAKVGAGDTASKAESAKKEIEAESEQKKQDAAKAKMDAEQRAKDDSKKSTDKESEKQTPAQESAETLLADLNTKMGQLIRITQEQKDLGERQLSVQRGLSKDLFASV